MTEKSYAKVNIFLKISKKNGNYHELVSRFVRVHSLFDTVSFIKSSESYFKIIGNFSCEVEKNSVFKAYKLLEKYPLVKEFFNNHFVQIEKNIPEFAGLGGGSSNAATFLNMVNKVCNLNLSKDELAIIGKKIGADVPFFVYEYDSANVTGIGEIVEKFDEDILDISIITPKVQCCTAQIFKSFRENFYKEISSEDAKKLLEQKSMEVLKNISIEEANDLYISAKSIYPQLALFAKEDWFFSGSGSSFFRINSGKK